MPYRIGYIVGSLSVPSLNRELAHALIALAPGELEFVEIPFAELPVFTTHLEQDPPDSVLQFKAAIEAVDGVIIVTPEYLRSIPGGLKNALDWSSRPSGRKSLAHKPVGILGASVGPTGTMAAQQHLRNVLVHLNAPTLNQPEVYVRHAVDVLPGGGTVTDDKVRSTLEAFLAAFLRHVALHSAARVAG